MQRCQFKACFLDGTERELNGKKGKNIGFNPELCWGCGLCANSCPNGAIMMEKIDER
ncbi:4Fe-4S binding protein [Candidatus Formimonas warabiya]|uniref:4Fe-4S binding protein n=1 Tax=Formimonas warabiya TaxID=1761012 RepID=UPI003AAEC31D